MSREFADLATHVISHLRILQDRRGDIQRLIGRMKLVGKETHHQLQAVLHKEVEAFRSLGDSTFHQLEDMRSLARSHLDQFEYQRLSSNLVKALNELEAVMLRHIEDEQHEIDSRRSLSHVPEEQQAQQDPTDSLLVSLGEVEAREDIIREREEGIIQIQKDVRNLRGLFQDVAYHVNQQGTLIDNIEANLISATERTGQANEELIVTQASSRKNTKNYIIALLLLLVIVVSSYIIIKNK
jgi:SNARE domain